MQLLVGLAQVAIALAISGGVLLLVGPAYVAVAMLVLATCFVLLLDFVQKRSTIIEVPVSFSMILRIIGTSFVFGLIWPALPVILTWKHADEKLIDDE